MDTTLGITKRLYFSCAHHSLGYSSLAKNSFVRYHNQSKYGSNFNLFVSVSGNINDDSGMILPLSDLKKSIKPIIDTNFDHQYFPNAKQISTITDELFTQLSKVIPKSVLLNQIMLIDEAGEGAFSRSSHNQLLITTYPTEIRIYSSFINDTTPIERLSESLSLEELSRVIYPLFQQDPNMTLRIPVSRNMHLISRAQDNLILIDFWFSFPHQIYNSKLTSNKNMEIFGHCTHCHGHNFRIRIAITETDAFNPKSHQYHYQKCLRILTSLSDQFESEFVGKLGTCERLLALFIAPAFFNTYTDSIVSIQLRETENNFIHLDTVKNASLFYFD